MELDELELFFDPFMDDAGEVYLQVRLAGTGQPQAIPYDSPAARGVIKTELSRVLGGRFPTEHQTRSFMEMLYGYAFFRKRVNPDLGLEYLLASDPVAKAIYAVHLKGGAKQPTRPLLAMLLRVAEREGIEIRKGRWPLNEDAMGKRLSMLKKPFADRGIILTYHDTLRPRQWEISPFAPRSGGSDGKVSDPTPGHHTTNGDPATSPPLGNPPQEVTPTLEQPSMHDGREDDGACTLNDNDINSLFHEEQP